MSTIHYDVVRLGNFSGGSFGIGSAQDGLIEVWTVKCPANPLIGNVLPVGRMCAGSKEEAERLAAAEAEADEKRLKGEIAQREREAHVRRDISDLQRGWDGCRFVGKPEARRRLAAMAEDHQLGQELRRMALEAGMEVENENGSVRS